MIRYAAGRLFAVIPRLFGITLVTFALVNLTVYATDDTDVLAEDSGSLADARRAWGLHLPLFINLSIQDIRARCADYIEQLRDPATRNQAIRAIGRLGGAAIPHVLPRMDTLDGDSRQALLAALEKVAANIHLDEDVRAAADVYAFWKHFEEVYPPDFSTPRARRLVRRYALAGDQLAHDELVRLGTFALPYLMEVLDDAETADVQARVTALLSLITGRTERIWKTDDPGRRRQVVAHWQEWWFQRYDMYTAVEGFDLVTGAITQTRYFRLLSRIATWDFGISAVDGRPVQDKIAVSMPITLLLVFLALATAYVVAVPLGLTSALLRDSWFDKTVAVGTFVLYSVPGFWVAMILLHFLSTGGPLPLLPLQGLSSTGPDVLGWDDPGDLARHLVLPVWCLSLLSLAVLTRYQRMGMRQVLAQDYMRTARAKGLPTWRIVFVHGLRNALLPLVTAMGLQVPTLIGGAVVIERIFGIPGMGAEVIAAIAANDTVWLVAVVAVTGALTMLGTLLSDVLYALLDPRIAADVRTGRLR